MAEQEEVIDLTEKFIIGIDINTHSTGFSILTPAGELVTWGVFEKESVCSNYLLYTEEVKHKLIGVKDEYGVYDGTVFIEDFMRSYTNTSRKTLTTLAAYNASISYMLKSMFGEVVHVNCRRARATLGLKSNGSGIKAACLEYVEHKFGEVSGSYNLNCKYDIADATVMAMYGYESLE